MARKQDNLFHYFVWNQGQKDVTDVLFWRQKITGNQMQDIKSSFEEEGGFPGIRELKQPRRRRRQEPHKFAYLTMKNIIFARFARAFFIFWHFVDVLVLSTTWNDLFCSCADDVSIWWQMFNLVVSCSKRWFPFDSRIKHIFQAYWVWIIEKWLQKREVTFSDDVLAFVDVVFA